MSSFFSRFRSSSKRKNQAGNGQSGGIYRSGGASQNSSATSLPSRRHIPTHDSTRTQHASQAQSNQINNPGSISRQGSNQSHSYPGANQPLFLQNPFVRAALVKGSFQTIVELPKYVDINEWLALNIFEFNTYLSLVVSLLQEYIDNESPMNVGAGYDYLWIDANKQAVRLPAATYIEYTLSWITAKFDDQSLFPTRQGVPFGPSFQSVVKSIYVQQFRIFAYIYHNHFDKLVHLSLEPHWNSLFCHFASFGRTFGLLEPNEITPLAALIQSFEAQGKIKLVN